MTTEHIIDLEDLIKDAFQQFHRNTITRQPDYFISGKKCIAFMEFDIVVFEFSIVFICKSHKEQALPGRQISEFAATIYATVKVQITSCDLDGKRILVASDTTKTKSSMRTLPLVPFMRERLLALKEEQEENRRLCGRSYIKDYTGYVCVNEIGDLIKPHYVTESFPKLLKANGLRHIRFHDLRHSCASLLLANGVPMKQIQEWLGHSDFSTTANIYAHLDYSSKLTSADAMLNGLGLASN